MLRNTLLVLVLGVNQAFAWGELGHHLVGRLSGKLLAHHPKVIEKLGAAKAEEETRRPGSFLYLFYAKRIMLGHLGNIPDSHWRNISPEINALGDPTHYLDREYLLEFESQVGFAPSKIPLDYEDAKRLLKKDKPKVDLFKEVGTVPWRAQQFADLYSNALKTYPRESCDALKKAKKLPSRDVQSYAGILSHFTADCSMPLHSTKDHDGVATNQMGLHWYWESDLVDALEPGLEQKVWDRALRYLKEQPLHVRMKELYPKTESKHEVVALVLTLLEDSAKQVEMMKSLDRKYAIKDCPKNQKGICRRAPTERVEGKTVAEWNEPMIVERLALSTALTADIWARLWLEAGAPDLCYTWDYSHKPSFVSPSDANCFGYAGAKAGKAGACLTY